MPSTLGQSARIDQFFAGPGGRGDAWKNLVELVESWARGSGNRAEVEAALAALAVTEGFHAYPGVQLMTALRERAQPRSSRRRDS